MVNFLINSKVVDSSTENSGDATMALSYQSLHFSLS